MSPFDFGKNFLEEQILASKSLERRILSQNMTLQELIEHLGLLTKNTGRQGIIEFISELEKLDLPLPVREHIRELTLQLHQSKVIDNVGASISSYRSGEPVVRVYDEWSNNDGEYDVGSWYESRTFSPTAQDAAVKENTLVHLSEDIEGSFDEDALVYAHDSPSYEGVDVVVPNDSLASELGIMKYNVNQELSQDTFPYQYVASIIDKVRRNSSLKEFQKEEHDMSNTSVVREDEHTLEVIEPVAQADGFVMNPSDHREAQNFEPEEGSFSEELSPDTEDKEPMSLTEEKPVAEVSENIDVEVLREEESQSAENSGMSINDDKEKIAISSETDFPSTDEREFGEAVEPEAHLELSGPEVTPKEAEFLEKEGADIPSEVSEREDTAQILDPRDDTGFSEGENYEEISKENLIGLDTMSFDTPSSIAHDNKEKIAISSKTDFPSTDEREFGEAVEPEAHLELNGPEVTPKEAEFLEKEGADISSEVSEREDTAQILDPRDDTEFSEGENYEEISKENLIGLDAMSFDTPSSLTYKNLQQEVGDQGFVVDSTEDFSQEQVEDNDFEKEETSALAEGLEHEAEAEERIEGLMHSDISIGINEPLSEDAIPLVVDASGISNTRYEEKEASPDTEFHSKNGEGKVGLTDPSPSLELSESHPNKRHWWDDAPTIEYEETQDFGTFVLYRDLG